MLKGLLAFGLTRRAIVLLGLLVFFEQLMARWSPQAYDSFSRNIWYKWLLIIFMAVSLDILLLNKAIPRYRKLLGTVRKYKDGIIAKAR